MLAYVHNAGCFNPKKTGHAAAHASTDVTAVQMADSRLNALASQHNKGSQMQQSQKWHIVQSTAVTDWQVTICKAFACSTHEYGLNSSLEDQ